MRALSVDSYTYSPDMWGFGCVLAEVLLGGRRLFDATALGVRTDAYIDVCDDALCRGLNQRAPQQLLLLMYFLGSPTQADIIAMNPALAESNDLRLWMRVPPRPRKVDPLVVVEHFLTEHGAAAAAEMHVWEAMDLLRSIFLWDPTRRPSARTLRQSPFLS